MDLMKLREANILRQNEWQKGESVDLSFRGNELAGETGEACNVIKKLERERLGYVGSRATVEDLADELADIIICVDLVAEKLNIDLSKSIVNKFNKTSQKYNLMVKLNV